ncbi:MAG: response regulator [Firmicutes bacterium]|nr:response regulator [Bacillota bacterium]
MKAILIDDEPIALEVLESILSSFKEIEIIKSYTKPNEVLGEIGELQPDVVFLDIEMGEINGLELAESLMRKHNNLEIVFITAYSQYAVEAFEINAIDYLLKPIQKKRLINTIKRLKKKSKKYNMDSGQETSSKRILQVNCFGNFSVMNDQGRLFQWRTKKAKELFAYLWFHRGRTVPKTLILETIFPGKTLEEGTAILHTTVYMLRTGLRDMGFADAIYYVNECYQLNVHNENDLSKLMEVIDKKKRDKEDIEKILNIYKGSFLEEEGYHWSLGSQQRYKKMVFSIFDEYVTAKLNNHEYSLFIEACLLKMHEMDPFDAKVVRDIIKYYGRQNNKASLKIFFDSYVERLSNEMNLNPDNITLDFYSKYYYKNV